MNERCGRSGGREWVDKGVDELDRANIASTCEPSRGVSTDRFGLGETDAEREKRLKSIDGKPPLGARVLDTGG